MSGLSGQYSIAESIEDETTLPIKHLTAPSTMTVPAEQLDRGFFELAAFDGSWDRSSHAFDSIPS